ncbi:MAG: hypothetical protein WCT03_16040 [Candidatus Obscuribacterales bacterium]|jgi:hypothetical protein
MSLKQSVSIVVAAVVGGIVGSSIVLSEVGAQDYSELVRTPKTLTANAIELTDGNGHVRCKISAEGGSPICFFYGPVGKVRMRIGLEGVEDNYAPFIVMNDLDWHERLRLSLESDGKPSIRRYGKKHFNKRVEKLLLQPKQTKEFDIRWPTTTETAKP